MFPQSLKDLNVEFSEEDWTIAVLELNEVLGGWAWLETVGHWRCEMEEFISLSDSSFL